MRPSGASRQPFLSALRTALARRLGHLRSERGLALPELIVASALSLVIFGAAVEGFVGFLGPHRKNEKQTESQDAARRAIDRMAIQLRSAMSTGATGAQPVLQHSAYNLVYLVPRAGMSTSGNPRGLVYTRYCLDGSNPDDEKLRVQTKPYHETTQPNPPSTAACPGTGWDTSELLASNLVNQIQSPAKPLFTTCAAPCDVGEVIMHAVVDVEPTKAPIAVDLRTKASVRNLNRAPTARITCAASGNGRALCDASASSDPDAQTLTFAWKMNGTSLSETSYRLDQPGLTAGQTYTFEVTVTDSGGVSSSAQQSLTMPSS